MLSHNVYKVEKNQKKFEKPPVDKKNTINHTLLAVNHLQKFKISQATTKKANSKKNQSSEKKNFRTIKKNTIFAKLFMCNNCLKK